MSKPQPATSIATTVEHFARDVLDASRLRPILVDFWAEWCPPCVALAPILDRVVASYADAIGLVKVEVDDGENMKLAGHYRLRGFPTVLMFVAGEEVGRFSSAKPEHWVREFIETHRPA